MFNGFDLSTIQDAKLGSTQVSALYFGSHLIWPTSRDYSRDYLTFTPLEDTTFTFLTNALQYSLDNGASWTTLSAGTASPTVTTGNKILWKQTSLTPDSNYGIGRFTATGHFNASGNIMSLYYGDNFIGQTNLTGKDYAFKNLFGNCVKLINAENLVLPATTLSNYCYEKLFFGCSSLISVPNLPATTLTEGCYQYMFDSCGQFTPPQLPATTLAYLCYYGMFWSCPIRIAPQLPATTLATNCYSYMFAACGQLITAPELPATTLAEGCYRYMFADCYHLENAPKLYAPILERYCYYNMFGSCRSLREIHCYAVDISANDCTRFWVYDTYPTYGTFYKDANTTWPTGQSGIPDGWTVINV